MTRREPAWLLPTIFAGVAIPAAEDFVAVRMSPLGAAVAVGAVAGMCAAVVVAWTWLARDGRNGGCDVR